MNNDYKKYNDSIFSRESREPTVPSDAPSLFQGTVGSLDYLELELQWAPWKFINISNIMSAGY